jgi:hypothetical protein
MILKERELNISSIQKSGNTPFMGSKVDGAMREQISETGKDLET